MKKLLAGSVALFILLSSTAYAADDAGKTAPQHKDWTLDEARQHAHAYADKLDKMTPQEWNEHEKKRDAWFDKWHSMTPEEKDAFKKRQQEKRAEKAKAAAAKPAGSAQ